MVIDENQWPELTTIIFLIGTEKLFLSLGKFHLFPVNFPVITVITDLIAHQPIIGFI